MDIMQLWRERTSLVASALLPRYLRNCSRTRCTALSDFFFQCCFPPVQSIHPMNTRLLLYERVVYSFCFRRVIDARCSVLSVLWVASHFCRRTDTRYLDTLIYPIYSSIVFQL